MRNSKWILALVGLLACGLIAMGCGDDEDSGSSDATTEESSEDSSADSGSDSDSAVDVDEFLSSCEETVEGTPGADAAIAACEEAADALEQCADQAEASGDSEVAETAIEQCQAAADAAVKQFEALGG